MIAENTKHLPAGPGAYLIRNRVTGDCYVGSSKRMRLRVRSHLGQLRTGQHYSSRLQAGFAEHGESALEFVSLEECPIDRLNVVELHWVLRLRPNCNRVLPSLIAPRHGCVRNFLMANARIEEVMSAADGLPNREGISQLVEQAAPQIH